MGVTVQGEPGWSLRDSGGKYGSAARRGAFMEQLVGRALQRWLASSRTCPRPPSSGAALFSEVPSWDFTPASYVFSEALAVPASENTVFLETR
ncbi:hypothetical protein ACQPYK_28695 [Streptosporangium sp. CA-135522]|uniref:hypothetical protein n=1 Tax=Streptosporangium sp. CA-135522 TaxID=3240072 RepID=UPI003D8C382A